jgi:hypothetical protein
MDVLALPSFREGFPIVPLEAAAAQIPTVTFKATGSVDAVIDGVTGIVVPLGDVNSLARALQRYLENDLLRFEHGRAGRKRALLHFRSEAVWESLYAEYSLLLKEKSRMLFNKLISARVSPEAQASKLEGADLSRRANSQNPGPRINGDLENVP